MPTSQCSNEWHETLTYSLHNCFILDMSSKPQIVKHFAFKQRAKTHMYVDPWARWYQSLVAQMNFIKVRNCHWYTITWKLENNAYNFSSCENRENNCMPRLMSWWTSRKSRSTNDKWLHVSHITFSNALPSSKWSRQPSDKMCRWLFCQSSCSSIPFMNFHSLDFLIITIITKEKY